MFIDFGHVFLFLGLCQFTFSVNTRMRQNARQKIPLHPNAGHSLRKFTLLDAHVPSSNGKDQWFDKNRLISLKGTALAKQDSNYVTTSVNQQKALKAGDFILIIKDPLTVSSSVFKNTAPQSLDDSYEVIAVHATGIIIARPWPNESSDKLFLFKIRSSADSFIRKLRKQKARLRLSTTSSQSTTSATTEPPTTTAEPTTSPVEPLCNGTLLSELALIHDSRIVTTSVDMREDLHVGEYIVINDTKFVVTEPRDAITFSLSERWPGPSTSGVSACKPKGDGASDCITLSGCVSLLNRSHVVRTSMDLRDEIEPGQVIRLLWEDHKGLPPAPPRGSRYFESTIVHPNDEQTLTLAGPWTGPNVKCIKACRRRSDWDNNGLIPLCGTVATTKGSPIVYTTCDLRNVLNEFDWVRIGNESLVLAHPFTDKVMTMSTKVQRTKSDEKAYKVARELPLPGTLSVVKGSVTVTTSSDLRNLVGPGDLIRIFQNPMRSDRFEVALPQDMYTITISQPHPGPTAAGLSGSKVMGTAMPLSGTATVKFKSKIIRTSADLTGEVAVGDVLRIDDFEDLVVDLVTPTAITIQTAWSGVSSAELRIFRSGKSAEVLTLEALAREKLKCTTVYCLSQIEVREAALPFDFPRTLTASLSAAQDSPPPPPPPAQPTPPPQASLPSQATPPPQVSPPPP